MSIRQITWETKKGTTKKWVLDYTDRAGRRRTKNFSRKKDAEEWRDRNGQQIRQGTFTADSDSVTLAQAGKSLIQHCKEEGLERTTWEDYQVVLANHIEPVMGGELLTKVTGPQVMDFLRTLRREKSLSDKRIDRVRVVLSLVFEHAISVARATMNPVKAIKLRKKTRIAPEDEGEVIIPSKAELRDLLLAPDITVKERAFVHLLLFAGLRLSELRGLTWDRVDFNRRILQVRGRADKYGDMGAPKSAKSRREIALPVETVRALQEWKLQCPKGDLGLVMPNGAGNVENSGNIYNRLWYPLQIRAGLSTMETIPTPDGPQIRPTAKYNCHALRHAYASMLIARGMNPKQVQTLMGHSSIKITYDLYGHLFPDETDTAAQVDAMAAEFMQ